MLVSLQEQVDESKDSDKEEEATYDAQACTAERNPLSYANHYSSLQDALPSPC